MSLLKNIPQIPVIAVCVAMTLSCTSRKSPVNSDDATIFAVDSISHSDTLAIDSFSATVKISGQYPVGDTPLADSVKLWIAERLNYSANSSEPLFTVDSTLATDGKRLIATTSDSLLAMSEHDISGFVADDMHVNYEFDFKFKPIFATDSILTYSFAGYVYFGGAHGGAIGVGQTFVKNSGKMLNGNNMFIPEKRGKLIEMIKQELWKQYFSINMESDTMALREVLLIDPDLLNLPKFPPEFLADGINFTYQQYEIASYADGMPSCTISYDSIRPLLTAEVQRLLPAIQNTPN